MNRETDLRSQRKDEHVRHALDQKASVVDSDFNHVHFVHQSIPSFNLDEVDLSTCIGPLKLSQPLYINAMTGGSEWTRTINSKLAEVASATGIPMAVGSMHAALKHPELENSFTVVRDRNPKGLVFANVGADVSLDGAKHAIELIQADALQIHINAPQELIMPEGDRNFRSWLENIENIVRHAGIPVIVKEVGFGMSWETLQTLKDIGVRYADISGKGGTNFASIENARREHKDMDYLKNWGLSTAISLLEAEPFVSDMSILASGGIKTPLDAMKCLALGAKAVGMSRTMLEQVEYNGIEAAIEYISQFHHQMCKIAIMINARTIEEITQRPIVLSPEILSWQKQRALHSQRSR
ncbi:type 2 isopentenyl-diphosphate Delta-isomerase [Salinicoccus sp. ID82-1]|uniref:type 2 isopentenyl-diphosphate Delta-isomerase n=1 Tax=Salinicoccus sp. ID82-1 TaxID=2820269 RepID=UPI001F018D87|nr:type 2 isopentenyl-diphosphate Delta-isomerase [Salinicoccus sp. ID82-1]MCG1010510.1 type 2 isopentenyl-diphosphate Delta-isomerase [Salinicoccus sp. ID82-1]